jgi:hypothetical protein
VLLKGAKYAGTPAEPTNLLTLLDDGYNADVEVILATETANAALKCKDCGEVVKMVKTSKYGVKPKADTYGWSCPENHSNGGWHTVAEPSDLVCEWCNEPVYFEPGITDHPVSATTSYVCKGGKSGLGWHSPISKTLKAKADAFVKQYGHLYPSPKKSPVTLAMLDVVADEMMKDLKTGLQGDMQMLLYGKPAKGSTVVFPIVNGTHTAKPWTPPPPEHLTHNGKWANQWDAVANYRLINYVGPSWHTEINQDPMCDMWSFVVKEDISGNVLREVKIAGHLYCKADTYSKMCDLLMQAWSV